MKIILLLLITCFSLPAWSQSTAQKLFTDCGVKGSTTIFDYRRKQWLFTDSADAYVATQPASTFKIINLLIALETGTIKDENEVVKWPVYTDTSLYGYRPEIYRDLTVKEAFEVSAGWVFIELAKKIGRERYRLYLRQCGYGNDDLSHPDTDFWNFGPFAVTPKGQIDFLIKMYEGKTPFSKRNTAILKRVMIAEKGTGYIIRSKTGWTRAGGLDIGWWTGYVERWGHAYFFATRITKPRETVNTHFGDCRKTITKAVLRQLKALPPAK